jgi:UDP-N-acetylglucosamine--N-acetylmuramyl-(pentapeptide) pyrophosphoryl-undecaprenol N-acetylglucosamine transferase
MVGGSVMALVRGGMDITVGTVQARTLLKRLRPAAVIGFGGYPSVPTMMAATWLGLPTLLHEQNAVLGRANRLLASRVGHVATSFESVAGLRAADRDKVVLSGNPVRASFVATRAAPYPMPNGNGPLNLLVLGGSQGAHVFSRVVPAAIAGLPDSLRQRLRVIQQCRPEDIDDVRAAYDGTGIATELSTFFDDVPERLAAAHLVIARAGASTVAELVTIGRAAILVPYPHATDDHQTANARALDDQGAAWLMPQIAFCPSALTARLEALLNLPATLATAAARAHALGRPDAASRLADLVEREARGDNHTGGAGDMGRLAA